MAHLLASGFFHFLTLPIRLLQSVASALSWRSLVLARDPQDSKMRTGRRQDGAPQRSPQPDKMPPPPVVQLYGQPSKSACFVPDNRRQLEQQDRAYKKAKLAAASAPRLSPARLPKAKAVEVPKVPSCLQIGSKRPRPREAPAAPQVATPAAAAPAPAVSLVAYGDSDSEEGDPGDT